MPAPDRFVEAENWVDYIKNPRGFDTLMEALETAMAEFGYSAAAVLTNNRKFWPLLVGVQEHTGGNSILLFERTSQTAVQKVERQAFIVDLPFIEVEKELAGAGISLVEISPKKPAPQKALNLSHYTPIPRR